MISLRADRRDVVGAGLPAWLHLEFVMPLYLVGQTIPRLAHPAQRRAIFAVTAGLTGQPDEPTHSPHPLQRTVEVAALAAAGVAAACGGLGVTRAAAPLAAVVAAVMAVLRTGSSQAAILVGMPVLWIATALLPS